MPRNQAIGRRIRHGRVRDLNARSLREELKRARQIFCRRGPLLMERERPADGGGHEPPAAGNGAAGFATSVACMDGRVQEPIRKWMVGRYGIRYVDVVTRPGIDGMVASGRETRGIRDMIEISLNAHGSTTIVVSGHHDCAGNPVGEAAHREDIRESVRRLAEWYPDAKVVGVWVNAEWEVDLVA